MESRGYFLLMNTQIYPSTHSITPSPNVGIYTLRFFYVAVFLFFLSWQKSHADNSLVVEDLGNPHEGRWGGDTRIAANAWDMQLRENYIYFGSGERERNAGPIDLFRLDTRTDTFFAETTIPDEQIVHFSLGDNGDLLIPAQDPRGLNPGPGYIRSAESGEWRFLNTISEQHFYALFRYQGLLFTDRGTSILMSDDDGATWTTLLDGYPAVPITPRFFQLNGKLYLSGMFFFNNTFLRRFDMDSLSFVSTGVDEQGIFGDKKHGYMLHPAEFSNRIFYLRRGENGNSTNNFTTERQVYSLDANLDLNIIPMENGGIARDVISREGKVRVLTNVEYRTGLVRGPRWSYNSSSGALNGNYIKWNPQNNSILANVVNFTFSVKVEESGNHTLHFLWPNVSGLSTNAKIGISTRNGKVEKTLNQTQNGGEWVSLGSYPLTAGEIITVTLFGNTTTKESVAVDGLRIVREHDAHEIVIDDRDRQYFTEIMSSENGVDWEKELSFITENMTRSFEYYQGAYYISRGSVVANGTNNLSLSDYDRVDDKIGTVYKVYFSSSPPATSYEALSSSFDWGSTPLADREPLADANNNGIGNLLEFAFNLSPTAPGGPTTLTPGTGTSGLPAVSVITPATPTLRIEYLRRKNSALTYTVKFSDDLVTWEDAVATPTSSSINTNWDRMIMPDTAGSGRTKRFARVVVSEGN